jgi:hypothetical protein
VEAVRNATFDEYEVSHAGREHPVTLQEFELAGDRVEGLVGIPVNMRYWAAAGRARRLNEPGCAVGLRDRQLSGEST